MNKEM